MHVKARVVLACWCCALATTLVVVGGTGGACSPAILSAAPPSVPPPKVPLPLSPSEDVAAQRGPAVFNAVHGALRQWGSSVHHNGMSLYPARVPAGVLLYHGNGRRASPTEPDWLAYEIEHAEYFARGPGGRGPPPPPPGGPGVPPPPPPPGGPAAVDFNGDNDQQVAVFASGAGSVEDDEKPGGWLHVYRATRELRYLYVDGMSGGKTTMGTLDTQDLLLRGLSASFITSRLLAPDGSGGPMSERERAADLCRLATGWGLQGIIRMEAGFEIIHCDFSDGLEQVQVLRRPPSEGGGGGGDGGPGARRRVMELEFLRGLSERYGDIGAGRTMLDYSGMVSALFFDVNLTNPDAARPDLPRLVNISTTDLTDIREYLEAVLATRSGSTAGGGVDWRGVTDLVVGRYADRLLYMGKGGLSLEDIRSEMDFLTATFVDGEADPGSVADAEAAARCGEHYVGHVAAISTTASDRAILAAVRSVTGRICGTLFSVRRLLYRADASEDSAVAAAATLRELAAWLEWARFRRCAGGCDVGEVCVVPMWPYGTVDEYYTPRCTNGTGTGGPSYWGLPRPSSWSVRRFYFG